MYYYSFQPIRFNNFNHEALYIKIRSVGFFLSSFTIFISFTLDYHLDYSKLNQFSQIETDMFSGAIERNPPTQMAIMTNLEMHETKSGLAIRGLISMILVFIFMILTEIYISIVRHTSSANLQFQRQKRTICFRALTLTYGISFILISLLVALILKQSTSHMWYMYAFVFTSLTNIIFIVQLFLNKDAIIYFSRSLNNFLVSNFVFYKCIDSWNHIERFFKEPENRVSISVIEIP